MASFKYGVAVAGLLALGAASSAAQAQAPSPATTGWNVLLKVFNPATGAQQRSARFGQMPGAAIGYDALDLPSKTPFSTPYLYISFPHTDWGAKAGYYATDFRAIQATRGMTTSYRFYVYANPSGDTVRLSWEGDPQILQRSLLREESTGRIYQASDPALAGGINVTTSGERQLFVWVYRPL